MATTEQYIPDSDDEMEQDSSGDEMDEITVTLTPQEWKAKAGDLYKVGVPDGCLGAPKLLGFPNNATLGLALCPSISSRDSNHTPS